MSSTMEDETSSPISTQKLSSSNSDDDSSPGSLIRRTRILSEIYGRCYYSSLEPENVATASREEVWVKAMEEEIKMIEKNGTWDLVINLQTKRSLELNGSPR